MRPEAVSRSLPAPFCLSSRVRRRASPLIVVCLVTCLPVLAEPTDDAPLAAVRADIKATLAALATDSAKLTAAREHGFQLARDIAETTRQQADLAARIERKAARVAALHKTQGELRAGLEQARTHMRASAVARYTMSLEPRLKLFLNQDDVRALGRTLAYYDYIIRSFQREHAQALSQDEIGRAHV